MGESNAPPTRKGSAAPSSDDLPAVYFIEDVARVLRMGVRTIRRMRQHGIFPIPELPTLDRKPRWSRQAVEMFIKTGRPFYHQRSRGKPRRP